MKTFYRTGNDMGEIIETLFYLLGKQLLLIIKTCNVKHISDKKIDINSFLLRLLF
jgi:hypothetical protein